MRFKEFKITKSIIGEVSMAPGALQKWASGADTSGMLMGIEFEMCVQPQLFHSDTDDLENNPEVESIGQIISFYFTENSNGNLEDDVHDRLTAQYQDWVDDKLHALIQKNPGTLSRHLTVAIRNLLSIEPFYDQAKEQTGEHNDEAWELATQMREDEISRIMDSDDSEIYDKALDNVYDTLKRVFSKPISEKEWLNEQNVFEMYDVLRLDDELRWPQMDSADAIGKDFAHAVEMPVHVNTGYHGGGRGENQWIIEPDSSIKTDVPGDLGLEFVSPPQPIATTLSQMKTLMEWAKFYDCYTNTSTGLHINISVPHLSDATLDYVKLALFIGDNYILKEFGRTSNTYCSSALKIVKNAAGDKDVTQVLAKMREHLNVAASKLIHGTYTDKYTSINVQSGYVEFRGPGGDYLSRTPEDLTNTALRLAMGLNIACNEESHKQEYAKKLYKLLNPTGVVNDSVKMFVDYASGKINMDDLKTGVKQKQANREIRRQKTVQPALDPTTVMPRWYMERPDGSSSVIKAASEFDARRIAANFTNIPAQDWVVRRLS